MRNGLYKQLYNIAVYSDLKDGETLLALCDNAKEFANYLKVSENSARAILSKVFHGKTRYIIVNNKIRFIEFIIIEEEE